VNRSHREGHGGIRRPDRARRFYRLVEDAWGERKLLHAGPALGPTERKLDTALHEGIYRP
jgi:hypothetical protein